MDGELFRHCKRCREGQIHRYKFHKGKIMFFCNECGNMEIKDIPKELIKDCEEINL